MTAKVFVKILWVLENIDTTSQFLVRLPKYLMYLVDIRYLILLSMTEIFLVFLS